MLFAFATVVTIIIQKKTKVVQLKRALQTFIQQPF